MSSGPDSQGRLADRYALERPLGSGGMATVYLARDEVLGRPVAVKVLRGGLYGESGEDAARRFRREGRTAAKLSHPNIVPVYDAGEALMTRPGRPEPVEVSYIVMEYVPGGDLSDLLEVRGRLPAPEAAGIGARAADALVHAHGRGVIHRDVKPHNILLDPSGAPRLTDFGIARALEATHATRSGSFLGTALYSAPEQLRGRKVTGAADVYALGVTLYHAVTGRLPFQGAVMEVAQKHLSETPRPPVEVAPALGRTAAGRELSALILACLAKDPEARPSAEDLSKDLLALHESREAPAASPPPAGASPQRPARGAAAPAARRPGRSRTRRTGAVAGLLGAVLALALAGLWALGGLGGPETARQADEAEPSAPREPAQQVQQAEQPQGSEAAPRSEGAEGAQQPVAESPEPPAEAENESAAQPVASVAPSDEPPDDSSEEPADEPSSEPSEEQAAVQPVFQMYEGAVSGDYASSYATLTEGFKQRVAPTEAYWSGQYRTLESLEFIEGPEASISGETATVTGVTRAVHTDRTERNTAQWTLVKEGGEWKVNDLSILRQEIL